MALPPLELFSLSEKAALLPGGLFLTCMAVFLPCEPQPVEAIDLHIAPQYLHLLGLCSGTQGERLECVSCLLKAVLASHLYPDRRRAFSKFWLGEDFAD